MRKLNRALSAAEGRGELRGQQSEYILFLVPL